MAGDDGLLCVFLWEIHHKSPREADAERAGESVVSPTTPGGPFPTVGVWRRSGVGEAVSRITTILFLSALSFYGTLISIQFILSILFLVP